MLALTSFLLAPPDTAIVPTPVQGASSRPPLPPVWGTIPSVNLSVLSAAAPREVASPVSSLHDPVQSPGLASRDDVLPMEMYYLELLVPDSPTLSITENDITRAGHVPLSLSDYLLLPLHIQFPTKKCSDELVENTLTKSKPGRKSRKNKNKVKVPNTPYEQYLKQK